MLTCIRKIPAVSAVCPNNGVISRAFKLMPHRPSAVVSLGVETLQAHVFVINGQRRAVDGCCCAINRQVACNRDVVFKLCGSD